ncbi:MAG: transcriptional repressor [Spirochaetes bacterium]|nr:transcriptional repressor [Spirochaetota bacterium]
MIQDIAAFLKEKDISPSVQRVKIFDYLYKNHTHPTVDDIYQALYPEIQTLSKTTVYNTLRLFIDKKIATMITIDESETRYDADVVFHGHFKCRECEKIYDFDIDRSAIDLNTIPFFQIEEKHFYLKGICQECNKKK